MYWGCIYFLFSIFIFCTHFLYSNLVLIFVFIYFFVWHHFLFCLPLHFFFFFFYDNHQQRESKSVLRYDKSVIVELTDLIFFTKISLYSFSRKWIYQKVVFSFCIQILFFYIKNENKIQIQSQNKFFSGRSNKKLKMNTKYTFLLLKPNRP